MHALADKARILARTWGQRARRRARPDTEAGERARRRGRLLALLAGIAVGLAASLALAAHATLPQSSGLCIALACLAAAFAIGAWARDDRGRIIGATSLARDQRRLMELSFEPILVRELHGGIIEWNRGCEQLYGFTRSEAVGRVSHELLKTRFPIPLAIIEAQLLSEGTWTGLLRHVSREGRRIVVESRLQLTRFGQQSLVLETNHDITERRRAEAALERMARERERLLGAERAARVAAEAASHAKDEFLATVSHELRTPLQNILSWGRILQHREACSEAQLRQGLEIITNSALTQSHIIADLLDISRIVAGKIQLDTGPADLSEVLREAVAGQRPSAQLKGVSLRDDCPPSPVIAEVDGRRLQQVLWNLLSNAIKFTPSGGEVRAVVRQVDSWAEFQVSDTGAGISATVLPYVFDRFRQAEVSGQPPVGGLGLGLSIVKQLVELHGGSVEVRSAGVGAGAAFIVRLPLAADAAAPGSAHAEPAGQSIRSGQALKGVRVLAVEDDPVMLDTLTRVLSEHGAIVQAVAGGDAALAALREVGSFHLLLSDLGMTPVDGFALIRAVRKSYDCESLPAIAVSAFSRAEDRARAVAAGFQDYVVKPYDIGKLVTTVKRLATRPGAEEPPDEWDNAREEEQSTTTAP